ncbi:efflux RND transporter periplasmic adaptor subunit [Cupriavidus plantarum]|uniref:Membrane fusion protein (Multidrug efflux system) n=1 Tax=Cupriavidus plantarum TaxID=942865 RepID=A0A316ES42_9BURK|nr:HlyD family efflux transporter periplasmic adaptor subunit [Cupriavidus plantarum]PWK34356.1 membrane fusion protein (multidrug efflux system) [Cupriavidus plantarum]RLK31864.1 membrane fusion protein (multidrug efflux system) [Cupriavidus plantarum]
MNAPVIGADAAAETHTNVDTPAPDRKTRARKLGLTLIGAVVVAAGIGYGVYYERVARFHIETDDAYVNGNIVPITPQITGTVIGVDGNNTQIVEKGKPLVRIDPADARIALEKARADLGQTVRRVHAVFVGDDKLRADVMQRQTDLARAQGDLQRRLATGAAGAVSTEDVSHAHDAVATARAALAAAQQALRENRAMTDDTSVAQHPDVQAAAARVRDAYLAYARTTLPAPVTGYVTQRNVQVGQRVAPGTPLMSLVPLEQAWVDANFKEWQLRGIRVGQPATVTADVYGDAVTYHGRVIGLAPGTGSALALLPAQNATGNWIKVVQRLPVRIAIPVEELRAHPLRVGLSMNVDIDIRQGNDADNARAVAQTKALMATSFADDRTDVFAKYGDEADAEIARIIAANAR